MKIIVFDTETTGLPANGLPLEDQPHVCQFAGIVFDYDLKTREMKENRRADILIKPPIAIPHDATRIHGISNDKVKDAPSFADKADEIMKLFADSDLAVAHNIAFDKQLIGFELARLGRDKDFLPEQTYDTMMETKELCQIPGKMGGFRQPRLIDLYKHLFGKGFKDAHNALYDVMATSQCLYYLLKSGYYEPEEPSQVSLF